MWNMRRNINPEPMPSRRSTVKMIYRDLPAARRNWWLLVEPGQETDLCSVDPGFDVDLYVTTDLRTMTEVWMGYKSAARPKRTSGSCSPATGVLKTVSPSGSAPAVSPRSRNAWRKEMEITPFAGAASN